MYWFGLVAGWIVALRPASLAALATAEPMLWNSEPGFDVAIPTVCAEAGTAERDADRERDRGYLVFHRSSLVFACPGVCVRRQASEHADHPPNSDPKSLNVRFLINMPLPRRGLQGQFRRNGQSAGRGDAPAGSSRPAAAAGGRATTGDRDMALEGNDPEARGVTGAEAVLTGLKQNGIDYHLRQCRHRFPADHRGLRGPAGRQRAAAGDGAARDGERRHGARLLPDDRPAAGGDGARQRRPRQRRDGHDQRRERQRAGARPVGPHADHRGRPHRRPRHADPVRPGDVRPGLAGQRRDEVPLRDALSRAGRGADDAGHHAGDERAARPGLCQPAARAADGHGARDAPPPRRRTSSRRRRPIPTRWPSRRRRSGSRRRRAR